MSYFSEMRVFLLHLCTLMVSSKHIILDYTYVNPIYIFNILAKLNIHEVFDLLLGLCNK